MKSNYARKLNKANIIFGIHAAFKIVIILILFVVLYTSIWIKEKYLTYVKASVYVQIFVFLTLSIVILVVNNPHSMDICSTFINYFYLIISILELGIIIIEIYCMIKNLNQFLIRFHECPYCRTYEDITELDFKRTCLYYDMDNNNELPYKYICYYNSETEYYNSFCDGLICKKSNNKNYINSLIKCYKNIEKNEITFPLDNEYHLKEFELIYKYKSSNLYSCFRKDKIEVNNNIFNNKCPDSNPVQKMLIFIYSNIIIHLLIDFLFIYEFFLIQKTKEIYSNLVLLKNANQNNILSNEDEVNIQNYFNNSNSNNKQTFNTENVNPSLYPSYQIKKDNSQSIIFVPPDKNSEIEEIKNNYNEQTGINKSFYNKCNQYDNIIVHYHQNEEDNNNNIKIENVGIINRRITSKRNIYDENNKNNIEMNRRGSKQRMITMEVKKEEEYGINRINFYIKRKKRKKINKNKNDIDNKFNNDKKIINNNNNINNMKIIEENKIQIFNNINVVINNKTRNKNDKNSKSASKDCNSLNSLDEEQIDQNNNKYYNHNRIINISKNNSCLKDYKNKLINIDLFKNNANMDDIRNKNNNNIFKKNKMKNNINKYKIHEINQNEEHKNNIDNSGKYKEILNSKNKYNKDKKYLYNEENKCNNSDNKNKIKNDKILPIDNIHGNLNNDMQIDYKEQNLIKINRKDN